MDWVIDLAELAQQRPTLAAVAYLLTYAGVMMVGLPGGIAMLLLGGFVFGPAVGPGLALAGAVLAAGLTYPLARGPLGRLVARTAGPERLTEVARFVQRQGAFGLLTVRMIPLFPFALLNLALALARVPWWSFILTTALGTVPIALLMARVGSKMPSVLELDGAASAQALLRPDILLPIAVLVGLSLCGLIWRRREALKQAGRRTD